MSTKKPPRLGASRSSVMGVLAIAVIVAAAIWWLLPSRTGQLVDVVLPDLSRPAQAGQKVFGENCAACHGALGRVDNHRSAMAVAAIWIMASKLVSVLS